MTFGIRVNVGPIQNFICINIADASEAMLVEKEGFHLATRGLNKLAKRVLGDGESIRTESALYEGFQPGRLKEPQSSESARVPVM